MAATGLHTWNDDLMDLAEDAGVAESKHRGSPIRFRRLRKVLDLLARIKDAVTTVALLLFGSYWAFRLVLLLIAGVDA